jgi:peptidoglycan/LPS O-acetylase OafA/YrhL
LSVYHRSVGFISDSYKPQLDGLRAFAVFGVFFSHYVEQVELTGRAGVRLFFVLSGFLITRILLAGRGSIREKLRRFYVRRAFRLYPALLLLIVTLIAVDFQDIRQVWPWHLTYLSNVYFGIQGHWSPPTSILWTLSVEEQFYLIWPLFIFLTPRKYLSPACLALVLVGVTWKAGAQLLGMDTLWAYVSPVSSLDTLAMGAFTAIAFYYPSDSIVSIDRVRALGMTVALWALVGIIALQVFAGTERISYVFFDVTAALVFAWIISSAATGKAGRFLEWKLVVYLGKISYGLYLYHAFVPYIFNSLGIRGARPMMVAAYVLTSVALASLSWFLWEKPVRSLRDRLSNDPSRPLVATQAT